MKTLTINSVPFELTTPRKHVNAVIGYVFDENAIFHYYDRPSQIKVNIWKNWLKWARETDGIKVFAISSANCMQFSIEGLYTDEQGNKYNLFITRSHRRAIKVS